MISMDSNKKQNTLRGLERAANDNCFLVFIGGKDIDNIHQVLEQIKIISKKIGLLPNGIFMTTEKNYLHTTYQYPLVIIFVNYKTDKLWYYSRYTAFSKCIKVTKIPMPMELDSAFSVQATPATSLPNISCLIMELSIETFCTQISALQASKLQLNTMMTEEGFWLTKKLILWLSTIFEQLIFVQGIYRNRYHSFWQLWSSGKGKTTQTLNYPPLQRAYTKLCFNQHHQRCWSDEWRYWGVCIG